MVVRPKLRGTKERIFKPKGAVRALFSDPELEERAREDAKFREHFLQLKDNGLTYNTSREILLEGPAGTGKSYGALQFARYLCEKYQGIRLLFTRETRASLSETILELWEEDILGMENPIVKGGAGRKDRYHYDFPRTGSRVVITGMNNESRIMSGRYDGIFYFEGIDEQDEKRWDALLTRLRNQKIPHPLGHADTKGKLLPSAYQILRNQVPRKAKTIWDLRAMGWFDKGRPLEGGVWPDGTPVFFHFGWMDTNPGHPQHWLNLRPERKRDNGKPQMVRLLSRHEDNPTVTADYLDILRNLVPEQRARLYEGRWVAAEGQVYAYEPERHLIDVPLDMEFDYHIGGMDFGFEDAGVFQVWGVNATGMYRRVEVYFTKKLQAWWSQVVADFSIKYDIRVIKADPSRPDIIEAFNVKLGVEGARCRVEKAENSIQAGVDALRYGLTPGVGHPPLVFLARDAHKLGFDESLREKGRPNCLEQEFPGYVWDTWVPGKPYKDLPKAGQADHGLDTARYVAIEVMRPGMLPENRVIVGQSEPWQIAYFKRLEKMQRRAARKGKRYEEVY